MCHGVYIRKRPLGRVGGKSEAPSWKQQTALASYLAVLAGFITRLLVPDYISAPLPAGIPFIAASFTVLFAFFLPFFWWRTTVGYVFGILAGVATVVIWTGATGHVLDGVLPVESYIIIIPGFVFALLLVGSSVLAWREG